MTTEQRTDPFAVAADFNRVLEALMQERLDAVMLTPSRYAALARAEGQTVASLVPQLGVSQQRTSLMVKDLSLQGYLVSEAAPDKRSRVLRMTERGRWALAQVGTLPIPPALLDAMASFLDQQDL